MSPDNSHPTPQPAISAEALKSWIMVFLTLVFISLYGAALIGWLKPLTDEKMVMRLEPIIFVIIGYYFGRLPGQQNEQTLKQEIGRQTQRADASQAAKEQALQAREALEEKISNVRATLSSEQVVTSTSSAGGLKASGGGHEDGLPHLVTAALRILNS